MTFLFWLSLALGGGLFLISLVGEVFDAHGQYHADKHFGLDHGDTLWGKIVSLRTFTYFMFAFGAVGVGLSRLWADDRLLLTTLVAGGTGALVALLSALVFHYLSLSESGERPTDAALIGRVGQVTMPLSRGALGKVEVARNTGSQELLAKPLDEKEPGVEDWSSVVIVEVRDGIAYVAPYAEDSTPAQE